MTVVARREGMKPPAALLLLAASSAAPACMGVGRGAVRFAGQTNIVIWDAARGVEHFVRDARFDAAGPDLGFVAPTPSRPEIEAAKPEAFDILFDLAPKPPGYGSAGGAGGGVSVGIRVIERKLVAGYEATVLQASDTRALTAWMRQNGYPVPAYAARWAAPYVGRGWYLTAFKVAADEGKASTGPVRMTFATKQPFNPYSVPAENRGEGGLAVYFVSATGEIGKIGGDRPWVGWQWRLPLPNERVVPLAKALGLDPEAIPADSQVTLYEDPGFGRPGLDDVYFVPPPMPVPRWPVGPAALACLGAFAFVGVRRRG